MINVTGLSIKDIANIPYEEIETYNRADLAKLTGRLVSAANKRIRSLQKHGLIFDIKSARAGKFSTRGKDKLRLLKEFGRATEFLSRKTTLVRENIKNLVTLQQKILQSIDKETFFDVYKSLYHEGRIFEKFKYSTFEEIRTGVLGNKNVTTGEIANNMIRKLIESGTGDKKMLDELEKYKGSITNVISFDNYLSDDK